MNDSGTLVPPNFDEYAVADPLRMQAAGEMADQLASESVFADYLSRKATNTLRAQRADLERFAVYLDGVGVDGYDAAMLQHIPYCWSGVTWGIVEGFVKWQLKVGYAVSSVNRALSTVKTYAKLAAKASVLEPTALALIKTVSGYGQQEAKRVNERRDVVRIGWKKSESNVITTPQARQLKTHPDTPQGRRDAFLMCILLDHGLRVGEAALLTIENFDVRQREVRFYRPKVDKTQTHRLTDDTHTALLAYLPHARIEGRILHGSRKGGELSGHMSNTAITRRVAFLGKQLGIFSLSAHDCRHYWATTAARNGTPLDRLQQAGGWSSLAMPMRYIEAAIIANEGVILEKDGALAVTLVEESGVESNADFPNDVSSHESAFTPHVPSV